VLERLLPVVAEAEFAGGAEHLAIAPGELLFGDADEVFGGVGDDLVFELVAEGGVADGVADDGVLVVLGDAGEFLAQVIGVGVERFLELAVGLGGPPGKVGIVAGVESVPVFEGFGEFAGEAGGAVGGGLLRGGFAGGEFLAGAGDLLFHAEEGSGDFGGIGRLDADAVVVEFEDGVGEGEEREGVVEALFGLVEAAEFEADLVGEEDVIDLGVVGKLGEVHRAEGFEPGLMEGAEGADADGGLVDGVEAVEGAEVGLVTLDVGAEAGAGVELGGDGVDDLFRA